MLAFPGGAGYGKPQDRDIAMVRRDLARGYISAESAMRDYGLPAGDVEQIMKEIKSGEAEQ